MTINFREYDKLGKDEIAKILRRSEIDIFKNRLKALAESADAGDKKEK